MSLLKYEIEYVIKSSISILYKRLSTASGLAEWFADNVNIQNNIFTFYWDGSHEEAKILRKKEDKFIRFQWTDSQPDQYFEFKIQIDEMTKDISLIITDFAVDEDEKEENILLWNTQIDNLKKALRI